MMFNKQNMNNDFYQLIGEKKNLKENQEIANGLMAIVNGDLHQASKIFNALLVNDIENSYLHAVNSFIYHLMGLKGDSAKFDLARIGYNKALGINSTNIFALLQLGRLEAHKRNYAQSRDLLAKVLLLDPENTGALYELAVISYHMRDPITAKDSIKRLLSFDSKNPQYLHAASMIFAASGDLQESKMYFAQYKQTSTNKNFSHITKRINNWHNFHQKGLLKNISQSDYTEESVEYENESKSDVVPSSENNNDSNRMIVIDAVLMHVYDDVNTSKGINILEALKTGLTLGNAIGDGTTDKNDNRILQGLGIPWVIIPSSITSADNSTYNVNIVNHGLSYAEIISKPTLTTLLGKEAKFFSGNKKFITIQGVESGSLTETPTGITLKVTPLEIKNGFVTLEVEIISSKVTTNLGNEKVNETVNTFDIRKNNITSTVRVKFGETLMLAGMHERDQDDTNKGVPILKNIPFLQYFFSEEKTSQKKSSVLFLITPRDYMYNKQTTINDLKLYKEQNIAKLKEKHPGWFSHVPNSAIILKFFRNQQDEFRTGDVNFTKWGTGHNVMTEISQLKNFIWY